MKRLFFGMVGALLVFAARAELFKDGETVCFLGDSITHGGRFHSYVYDYYLTRFPDRTVRFVNAGISGDSAGARRVGWQTMWWPSARLRWSSCSA